MPAQTRLCESCQEVEPANKFLPSSLSPTGYLTKCLGEQSVRAAEKSNTPEEIGRSILGYRDSNTSRGVAYGALWAALVRAAAVYKRADGKTINAVSPHPPKAIRQRRMRLDAYLGASTVINIDKQRVAAVRKLEALGYIYQGGEWVPVSAPPAAAGPRSLMTAESDAMHGVVVREADALEGCPEGSDEEAEFKAIVDAIEAY